ncbi:unnamed protein product, partial [Ilex paraguariensis]
MATVRWIIWKARNQKIFNNETPDTCNVLRVKGLRNELINMEDMRGKRSQYKPMDNEETMQLLSSEFFICCDGAFKSKTNEASCVVLFLNSKGGLMDGASKSFFATSSLYVEAEAIGHACFLVKANSLMNATIVNDYLNAFKLIATENVPPWEINI